MASLNDTVITDCGSENSSYFANGTGKPDDIAKHLHLFDLIEHRSYRHSSAEDNDLLRFIELVV